jgi:ABC-type phosphate transport system substrate-binding protein
MFALDSVVTGLNKVIDNRQVTTVIVSAALVGVGGILYRLFDRYVRHRRAVSVTTIFDQAVNMATPNVTISATGASNVEGSTAFAHVVTEAATDYKQQCPASRITITANGSDAAISNHRGPLPNDTVLMVDYSGQPVPGSWKANPLGMIIYGVVANREYAAAVAGTAYALRNGYGTADLANLYQVASAGSPVPFVAVGRNGGSGTAAEFDSWTGLRTGVLKKASGCPDISATATTPKGTRTGICVVGSTQKMLDFVNDNADAIGFADIDEVTEYPNVTLLPVGGTPDQADVVDGTYTFAVPEYLYTSGSPSSQISAFLSFLRSPAEAAQLAAQDQGFIPCADLKGAVAGDCTVRQ